MFIESRNLRIKFRNQQNSLNIDVESIERATQDAFPPLAMEELPGWLLGLDPGKVGRAHSAAPLQHTEPDRAAVAAIEGRLVT